MLRQWKVETEFADTLEVVAGGISVPALAGSSARTICSKVTNAKARKAADNSLMLMIDPLDYAAKMLGSSPRGALSAMTLWNFRKGWRDRHQLRRSFCGAA